MELTHLLILGAARSGTTLLATMISRHSEICILNENKGWAMKQILGKRVVGNKRCVPNQIEMKRRSRFHFRFMKTVGLAKEYQSSEYSIEDYLTLPSVKVIGLIRTGDDVVSSIMKRSKKSFRIAAHRWCRAIEVLYELAEAHPDIVLVISFEHLVKHSRANMERVAGFLGVDYEDRMLEGPKFNPWYAETGMNESKVGRASRENLDFELERRFPAVFRKYQALVALSGSFQPAKTSLAPSESGRSVL